MEIYRMHKLIENIIRKAKADPKRIVFPEGHDPRIIKAVSKIVAQKIAYPILLGHQAIAKKLPKKVRAKIKVIDVKKSPDKIRYAKIMYRLRKSKGWSLDKCTRLIEDPGYFATMMVHCDDADGMVAGACHTTAETLRPALQIIKTKKYYRKVSGVFFMFLDQKVLLFADCAVIIQPTANELAEIAADTAFTAKKFGLNPRIAMLSCSTHGSTKHPLIDKVKKATDIVKKRFPKLMIDGELQVDAALVPEIGRFKSKKYALKKHANVLIFPDLQAANISYKLVERLAHAKAIGPLLQGFKKPVNDLSRGCSAEDIVKVIAFTVVEAQA